MSYLDAWKLRKTRNKILPTSESSSPFGWEDFKREFWILLCLLKCMLSCFENEVFSSDNVPKLFQKHSTVRGDVFSRYLRCLVWTPRS